MPQPFGPMSATIPPPGIGQVDAVEDRERAAGPGREGERQVLEVDGAGAGRVAVDGHVPLPSAPRGRRSGAVAG